MKNIINWYVDSDATGANNGTSWANAWKSLKYLTDVSKGDQVYIKIGSSILHFQFIKIN